MLRELDAAATCHRPRFDARRVWRDRGAVLDRVEAANGTQLAELGGSVWGSLAATFQASLRRLRAARAEIPYPPGHPVWRTARAKGLLRPHMSRPPDTDAVTWWQVSATLPLHFVDRLLVVASTGTGKSFVWGLGAHSLLDDGSVEQVCVIVKDGAMAESQRRELERVGSVRGDDGASPSTQVVVGRGGYRAGARQIRFLTYAQAGNVVLDDGGGGGGGRYSRRSLAENRTLIVMDEVHVLATPEAAGAWRKSVEALAAWLEGPLPGGVKLMGLTATPFVAPGAFGALMRTFTFVPGATYDAGAVGVHDLGGGEEAGYYARCGLEAPVRVDRDRLARALAPVSLVVYSADRNTTDFAPFNDTRVVPVGAGARDGICGRADGGPWSHRKLNDYRRRQRLRGAIVDRVLEVVRGDPGRKTVVFAVSDADAEQVHRALAPRLERLGFAPGDVFLLRKGDGLGEQQRTKTAFGAAGQRSVLVTQPTFAVSHTFDDSGRPARRGIRRIITTPLPSYHAIAQMKGRARRWRMHAGLTGPRDIDFVMLVPHVGCADDAGGHEPTTCEEVFTRHVGRETRAMEAVESVMFEASFGSEGFWDFRPGHVQAVVEPGFDGGVVGAARDFVWDVGRAVWEALQVEFGSPF